jgi:hypothetical protein
MTGGRRLRAGRAALVIALLALAPAVAHACPVCFDPRDENRFAFLATTIFLSLLPLGLAGGMLLWVRHRWNTFEAEQVAPEPEAQA